MKKRSKVIAIVALVGLLLNVGLAFVVSGGQVVAQNPPNYNKVEAEVLVIRIFFKDKEERNSLAAKWGAIEQRTDGGFVTVVGDKADLKQMQAEGLRVEIDQEATYQFNNPNLFGKDSPDTFYGGYKTVEEMIAFLDQKAAAYPNLAEKIDFGDTWCKINAPCTVSNFPPFNGYDMWAMHITNRNIAGPKPVFWYDGAIHSREIAVPEVAMNYISLLLDNYDTNADARWLVDYHDIWVVPMFNADGHHLVEQRPANPYLHRKNSNYSNGCTTFDPNGNGLGTDMNRNFPWEWGLHNGSSGSPCSQTYRGPTAGSEPETQAVKNKIMSLIPDQRDPAPTAAAPLTTTGIMQSMHTVAELNLYPWGWDGPNGGITANNAEMRNIAAHMSALDAGGNGYDYGRPPELLYNVDGDSNSWVYGELGIPAYTTELSGGSFIPAFNLIQSAIWPENRGMLLYMAKIARTPYLLSRGPDLNQRSIPISVTLGAGAVITGSATFAWTANTFSQNVGAAEFYVDTPPWVTGSVANAMTAVDGNFNSPTESVEGVLPTAGLSLGRHIVFIRGRGATNYQGFQTWGPVSAVFVDVIQPGVTPTVAPTQIAPTSTTGPSATTQPSNTPVAPTATRTNTPLPSQTVIDPFTPVPSATSQPTNTQVAPTATRTPLPVVTIIDPFTPTPLPTTQPTNVATTTPLPSQTVIDPFTPTPVGTAGPSATACVVNFTDVPTNYIFYSDIQFLACRRVINGFPNGNGSFRFEPNSNTSRAQFAKIATLGFGLSLTTPPNSQTFSDVPSSNIFYQYVEIAYGAGAVQGLNQNQCAALGVSSPCYGPNLPISRVQTAVIIQRIRNYTPVTPATPTFADVPANAFGYAAVETLAGRAIINGSPCSGNPAQTCFRPNASITRGELSKVTRRAIEILP